LRIAKVKRNFGLFPEQHLYNSYNVNPAACAWCNKCKNHCPQSISVPDVLEGKVVKLFMQ
ncbi:MAG: hypothetical protein ACLTSM_03600, partial [Eubacterium sp.]